MSVLVILIVLLFVLYLFYKTKYFRSNRPAEKKWLSAKSSIALGLFVFFFGINTVYLSQTTVTIFVAAVFIIIGGISSWTGYKAYKHYLPFAVKEAETLKRQ